MKLITRTCWKHVQQNNNGRWYDAIELINNVLTLFRRGHMALKRSKRMTISIDGIDGGNSADLQYGMRWAIN
jgi:hypothetical protein